jgi:hypothetical protein
MGTFADVVDDVTTEFLSKQGQAREQYLSMEDRSYQFASGHIGICLTIAVVAGLVLGGLLASDRD